MLAIAVGQSTLMLNVRQLSRASFAPTLVTRRTRITHPAQPPVGAELARDSGGSVNIDVEYAAAFASKLCSYIGYAPLADPSSGTTPCGS
ncbi:hypothetical protein C9I50_19985 [Pseudomonas prosekii]|nr:hypothetical protein C9I50_19985 [Pseudomonas prosekii]